MAKHESKRTQKKTIDDLQKESIIEQFSSVIGLLAKAVVEKFGEEGREVVEKACFESGRYVARRFMETRGVEERGTFALAKHVYPASDSRLTWVDEFGKFTYLKLDDKQFAFKVEKCPYLKHYRAVGVLPAMPYICDLVCQADAGVGKTFNPKLNFSLLKCMARGDEYCIYQWKEDQARPV
jgi:predicted hydrocarbon binding protein